MKHSFISGIDEIEYMAKQVIPSISIVEKRGLPNGTYCCLENGKPMLYWDPLMCDFFEKTYVMVDTFSYDEQKDQKLITEMAYNYFGIILDHLSRRNEDFPAICSCMKRKANEYHYPYFAYYLEELPEVSEWKLQYYIQTGVVKLLIMYHELAHMLFAMDSSEKEKWVDLVAQNLQIVRESGLYKAMLPKQFGARQQYNGFVKKLMNKDVAFFPFLEELAADAYAISKAYATTHLNLDKHFEGKEGISDQIMSANLRYVSLATQYAYFIKYWNQFFPMLLSGKEMTDDRRNHLLQNYQWMATLRGGHYALVSLINVIQTDVLTWGYESAEGISLSNPRIRNVLDINANNASVYDKIMQATFQTEFFNELLQDGRKGLHDKDYAAYDYPVIQDEAIVITWMGIQYHNSLGLEHLNQHELPEALKEFQTAAAMTERYLGHKHRLTARSYNNICTCYLQAYLDMRKDGADEADENLVGILRNAYSHSMMAVNILKDIDENDDIQAGSIHQNMGEVLTILGDYTQAIEHYTLAKNIKSRKLRRYSGTHATTDFSLAGAYCATKHYLNAKKCCKDAIAYYKAQEPMNPKLKDAENLYEYICWMMNPAGGSMLDIMSTLMSGGTVNLDQYNDWDEYKK